MLPDPRGAAGQPREQPKDADPVSTDVHQPEIYQTSETFAKISA